MRPRLLIFILSILLFSCGNPETPSINNTSTHPNAYPTDDESIVILSNDPYPTPYMIKPDGGKLVEQRTIVGQYSKRTFRFEIVEYADGRYTKQLYDEQNNPISSYEMDEIEQKAYFELYGVLSEELASDLANDPNGEFRVILWFKEPLNLPTTINEINNLIGTTYTFTASQDLPVLSTTMRGTDIQKLQFYEAIDRIYREHILTIPEGELLN